MGSCRDCCFFLSASSSPPPPGGGVEGVAFRLSEDSSSSTGSLLVNWVEMNPGMACALTGISDAAVRTCLLGTGSRVYKLEVAPQARVRSYNNHRQCAPS